MSDLAPSESLDERLDRPRGWRWGRSAWARGLAFVVLLGAAIGSSAAVAHRGLHHLSIAGWLLIWGGFFLLGSGAMWFRTESALSYGEPDPYAPPGYPRDKLSWWGGSELGLAPLYLSFPRSSGQLLLVADHAACAAS
jgi:hypothetical protein